MSKVTAVKAMLHLKLVRQASTATHQHQRISATTAKLENQVHKEQRNVKHGTSCELLSTFFLSLLAFFSLFFFSLVRKINASIYLSSLFSLVHPLLFPSHPTVTRENSTLPLAKYVPSVQPASSNNKILTQVFRASRAQQDLSSHFKAPHLALILVVSNPPIVRMTSTSTRPLATVRTVLQVAPALVPLTNQAFAHYSDGRNVLTMLSTSRLCVAPINLHVLALPIQHSRINSLMPRKMILLLLTTSPCVLMATKNTQKKTFAALHARPTLRPLKVASVNPVQDLVVR